MQRIKQIKVKIVASCLIFLMTVFVYSEIIGSEKIAKRPWYEASKDYIEADNVLLRNAIDKKETFTKDYSSRSEAEKALLKASNPLELELTNLLKAQDVNEIKIALVLIGIKQIYSEQLFDMIADRYDDYDNYSFRSYSLRCFKFLDDLTLKKHEDDFLNMISKEDNESLLITGMPVLTKLNESKILFHFVHYLRDGTSGLRNVCYIYLCQMDNGYVNKVKDQLKKENVEDALFYLDHKCTNK